MIPENQEGVAQEAGTPNQKLISESQSNSFERQLFRDGPLRFNDQEYLANMTKELERKKDWYNQNQWDEKHALENFTEDIRSANYNLLWQLRFSGRIPKRWSNWYNVLEDLEKAREQGIALNGTLIDAGIAHEHHSVVNIVGTSQRLNTRQTAWLFIRPHFPDWNRDEIIAAQKGMGVTDEEIDSAVKLAHDVLQNAARKGQSSLGVASGKHSSMKIDYRDK